MANLTIPDKTTGQQHFATEYQAVKDWINSPLKPLGPFMPGSDIDFSTQGYYDPHIMTGDETWNFTNIIDGITQWIKVTTDGTHTLTIGANGEIFNGSAGQLKEGTYKIGLGTPFGDGIVQVVVPGTGNVAPTPPTLSSITIENAAPTDVVMVFNEVVTGTNLGFTLLGTTSTTFASLSGSGTNTLTGVLGTAAANGETITLSYDSGIGDIEGTETTLESIVNRSVTNNIGVATLLSNNFNNGSSWTEINASQGVTFTPSSTQLQADNDGTQSSSVNINYYRTVNGYTGTNIYAKVSIPSVSITSANITRSVKLYIDANNYVQIINDSINADWTTRIIEVIGGSSNVTDYAQDFRVSWRFDVTSTDIIVKYWNGSSWASLATFTQSWGSGARYLELGAANSATTTASAVYNEAHITDTDFLTENP